MFPLFETICIKDGAIQNLELHEVRFQKSFFAIYNKKANYNIAEKISIPSKYNSGIYKLRFSYNENSFKIDFNRYKQKEIKSLKLITANNIEYELKYSNRHHLDTLYQQRKNCDDILIVKNGLITDTSICNIILFDGNCWYTPATPLLAGTARQKLLLQGKIIERDISVNDLNQFSQFQCINAMREPII